METAYDPNGNAIQTTTRERFHDETGTGALGDPQGGADGTMPKARVSYAGMYYDGLGRLTASVDVGTNGGTAWTRPPTVPARSDTTLVTSATYDAAGNVYEVTDPKGVVTRTLYDALGRTTQTIENYVDGVPSDSDDKTTRYGYDAAGHQTTLTLVLPGGAQQTTQWIYGVDPNTGSAITSNDLVLAVQHPDASTGQPSADEQESYTYDALGQVRSSIDRNGTTHEYGYDSLGRQVSDAVTVLGAGVDGSVRRIETAYDSQGNPYLFTSYDAAVGGNVVNQVRRSFNGLGQLTGDYQSHAGAVSLTTPGVQYSYAEMSGGANNSRLTGMTYPSGYTVNYNYAAGLDNSISRLSSLSDSTGTLESYAYLGAGTVVSRSHPQSGVDLSYIKQSGEANGDAGDQYTGLDRFGRVVDQRWVVASTGVATDRFQYGYDRDGNRTYRDNLVNSALGEVYGYDNLNQLTSFQRGTLNGTKDGITGTASRSQSWSLDAAGNFNSVTTDGTAQARTTNQQNETTAVGGVSLNYDANGDLLTDEMGRQLSYDAWGRLVGVKDSAGNPIVSYSYDALGRRVSETTSAGTREFYYSADWQVLEEAVNGQVDTRYVWSPVYTDALVLRDRDTNGDGTLDERLWVQQDANFNVTALVNGSGQVVERYNYDPFGVASVLNADGTAKAGGSGYDWKYLHQGLRYDSGTGLYDDRGRPYSPTLARFVQNDPKGFAAGDPDLYRYEGNGPTGGLDPSGLQDPRRAYYTNGNGKSIPYDPTNPGDLGFLQYMDLGGRAKQMRQEQPYRFFAGGMFDVTAPVVNPGLMILQSQMATLDMMRASQVPLEQRAANRAALRAIWGSKILSGDAEFYGQMTGTALMLAIPGAKGLRSPVPTERGIAAGGTTSGAGPFRAVTRNQMIEYNSQNIGRLDLARDLAGTTRTSTDIANAIRNREVGVNILGDEMFARAYRLRFGSLDEIEGTAAFAYGRQIYLRKGSPTFLADAVHEGKHALDATRNFQGSVLQWEYRAWFAERDYLQRLGLPSPYLDGAPVISRTDYLRLIHELYGP